jgi:hypothetical protein
MAKITDEMAEFMENERLAFVATVSPENTPNVSPKGSLMRSGDSSIAFAEIRSPDTVKNLESNPAVEVSIISPIVRRGYLFVGRGRSIREGPEFDRTVARFRDMGIQSPIGTVVIIDVDRTEETKSPLYDLGYTEDQIRETWQKRYLP